MLRKAACGFLGLGKGLLHNETCQISYKIEVILKISTEMYLVIILNKIKMLKLDQNILLTE